MFFKHIHHRERLRSSTGTSLGEDVLITIFLCDLLMSQQVTEAAQYNDPTPHKVIRGINRNGHIIQYAARRGRLRQIVSHDQDSPVQSMPEWWNWETRVTFNVLTARSCRFESCLGHSWLTRDGPPLDEGGMRAYRIDTLKVTRAGLAGTQKARAIVPGFLFERRLQS